MRSKKTLLGAILVSCLLSIILVVISAAQGASAPVAGEFDSYVFSLSWQPAFCETKPDKQECVSQTPDRYDAKNLVLHGLWPNKQGDKQHKYGFCGVSNSIRKLDKASTWCKMPAPGLSEDTKTNLAQFMPGFASCLERHEWYKHGTCSGLEADEYFTLAYTLTSKVDDTGFNKYISRNIGNTINTDDLLTEFEKVFGDGSRSYVNLFCEKVDGTSRLTEVRMYLKTDLDADGQLKDFLTSPADAEQGTCPQKIFIYPVAGSMASGGTTTTPTEAKPPLTTEYSGPAPLLAKGHPVDWWFVFKLNAAAFPECGSGAERNCIFGGAVQDYKGKYSQQFVYASSENASLQKGAGCVGDTLQDPVGATFDQVYNGSLFYVVWNDQFYGDPQIAGCSKSCSSPWGHSKGMLAWNDKGEGFVMQVSTPSWPASGSSFSPRKTDGNTLGCVNDNDVKVSQHFFSLRLSKDDVIKVLQSLQNASVVTDPANSQIVRNGGPSDVQGIVKKLGKKSTNTTHMKVTLSTGVELISKPSGLHMPPWQLVSAVLNGVPLRTATWWATPYINTSTASTTITCWNEDLGTSGPVQIATTGSWDGTTFSLKGGPQLDSNHAKIGVSTDPSKTYAIFGDLNQQGTLSGQNCASSQNGRGGTFYILNNKALFDSMTNLIKGETASVGTQ